MKQIIIRIGLVLGMLAAAISPAMADQRLTLTGFAPQDIAHTSVSKLGIGLGYSVLKYKGVEVAPVAYVGDPANFSKAYVQPGGEVSYFFGPVGLTLAEVHQANSGYNGFTSKTFASVLGLSVKL